MTYKIGDEAHGGIVFYVDETGKHGKVAAKEDQGVTDRGSAEVMCSKLVLNGFTDWFLPSDAELNGMYAKLHKAGLGGFSAETYWSSKIVFGMGTVQNFKNGNRVNADLYRSYFVRAARAF